MSFDESASVARSATRSARLPAASAEAADVLSRACERVLGRKEAGEAPAARTHARARVASVARWTEFIYSFICDIPRLYRSHGLRLLCYSWSESGRVVRQD